MPTTKTGPIWPARAITVDEAGPRHGPFAGYPQRPHLPLRGSCGRGFHWSLTVCCRHAIGGGCFGECRNVAAVALRCDHYPQVRHDTDLVRFDRCRVASWVKPSRS